MKAKGPPTGGSRPAPKWTIGSILLAGLAIREAFSFWTGHPYDFEVWVRTAYVVAHGENPYTSFWPAVPGVSFAYLGQPLPSAAYLPLWPALLGELYRLWSAVGGGNRFVLYFLLKQPGILADIGTAWLLYRLGERWSGERRVGVLLAASWSFFPYAILITAVWGEFDSLVVMIVLAILWSASSRDRAVYNGLGILAKWLTVIFLPWEFFRARGARRAYVGLSLAIAAAASAALFVAEGWSFTGIQSTGLSESHGGGYGMNYAYLFNLPVAAPLGGVPMLFTIIGYLWVPGVLAAGWVAARWVETERPVGVLRGLLLVVTAFLILRAGLYEQYLLYLFAPLLLDVTIYHPGRRPLFAGLLGVSWAYLILNNDLLIRFVSPLSPSVTTFTTALDASSTFGVFRLYALAVLAVVMTISLAQLAVVLVRDRPAPTVWWWSVGRAVRRWAGSTIAERRR